MKLEHPGAVGQGGLNGLLKALHLASQALPVGGFAYSHGLERAITDGVVSDAESASRWIGDALLLVIARLEVPLWLRAWDAATAGDAVSFAALNQQLLATRETAELRLETEQMGASLLRLLPALGLAAPATRPTAYAAAFAWACAQSGLARADGFAAWLWSGAESQVPVEVKSVPLGQQAGQVILRGLHAVIQAAIAQATERAAAPGNSALGSAPLGLALASSCHELLYSSLYRS